MSLGSDLKYCFVIDMATLKARWPGERLRPQPQPKAGEPMNDTRTLIAYFSRKGSNYLDGNIVDLPVGNTELAAQMIQALAGGDS